MRVIECDVPGCELSNTTTLAVYVYNITIDIEGFNNRKDVCMDISDVDVGSSIPSSEQR